MKRILVSNKHKDFSTFVFLILRLRENKMALEIIHCHHKEKHCNPQIDLQCFSAHYLMCRKRKNIVSHFLSNNIFPYDSSIGLLNLSTVRWKSFI